MNNFVAAVRLHQQRQCQSVQNGWGFADENFHACGRPEISPSSRLSKMNDFGKTKRSIAHTTCLARSLARWTGREVLPGVNDAKELGEKVLSAVRRRVARNGGLIQF